MFNIFGTNKQPQQPQGQQGQQQPPGQNGQTQYHSQANQPGFTPQNGATVPGGSNGGQGGNPPNPQNQPAPNPLDSYSKMFENTGNEGDKPPAFTLDPKLMDQVVSGQDFTKGINPELVQKALGGDMQSFMEVINSVSRNTYRASIEHGGVLTDKFVGASLAHNGKGLGKQVRSELTNHALSDTPNYQHPVVRQQLSEIARRIQQANPDAPPAEVAKQAKEYLSQLAAAINPNAQQTSQKENQPQERGEEFWNDYFSQDDQSS